MDNVVKMENIIEIYEKTFRELGNKKAVSDDYGTFTYEELYNYACNIIANLKKNNISYGDRVIVECKRSKEYVGALIGCWFMGLATVPLSDDYPPERLSYIKNDCKYKFIIDDNFIKKLDTTIFEKPIVPNIDDDGVVIYTSGSTGNPKGVVHNYLSMSAVGLRNVEHDKENNNDENDEVGHVAPFTFIVGVSHILAAFALKKHLNIVSDDIRKDPFKLAKYFDDHNVEMAFVAPRLVDFMIKNNKSLKRISVGSERITNLYYDDKPMIVNGYGATETFGGILAFKVDKSYENTPIGKPIGKEKAYVLDDNNNEVEQGELCIAGYIATKYLNLEEKSKKAFVENPFREKDGFPRMFRTGDIVRKLPDGNLEFVERKDWMIKINGQRVEPLEVESTIRRLKGIKQVAIKDFTAKNGITYLAAYYVADSLLKEDDIRKHCVDNLTSYMVPTFYIKLDELPLNPNGKLDRKNLPEPDITNYKKEYHEPQNDIEKVLCETIEKVLDCGKVGRDDDFYLLGGDSIKSLEVINQIDTIPIDLETFFEGKTPKNIAELIEKGGKDEIVFERVKKQAYPLTPSQLGIYFPVINNPETLEYNNPLTITLDKKIDVKKLIAAVEKAVNNHKVYKCHIMEVDGVPSMVPYNASFTVNYSKVENIENELKTFVQKFNLAKDMLIRINLYETNKDIILAFDAHHIVFDGTTLSILLNEIQKLYDGKVIFAEKTSMFDMSSYEEALIKSDKFKKAEEYYKDKFDTLEITNDFPTDYQDEHKGLLSNVSRNIKLDNDKIEKYLNKNGITENSLFLAAYSYVLSKFNGSDKSIVCVAESGRHSSLTFNTAGMLVKTIPLPMDFSNATDISDFIRYEQAMFKESCKYDSYPFTSISSKYGIINDFMFVYQGDEFSSLNIENNKYLVNGLFNPHAMSKLSLAVYKRNGEYRLSFNYREDLFYKDVIESFADTYVHIISEFLEKENINDIKLISDEQETILNLFNQNKVEIPDKTCVELFKDAIKKYPDNYLVVYKDKKITYKEADSITNKIANYISKLGLKNNDVVSILIPRNEWVVLSAYGVLRAGCAYEPLDNTYPSERLSFMVKDGGAKLLITTKELEPLIKDYKGKVLYIDDIKDIKEEKEIFVKNNKDDLLILLYTSGTTGTPKGVMLMHKGLASLIEHNRKSYDIDQNSKIANYASFGFDAGMLDIVTNPAIGACIHVIPEEIRLDIPSLDKYFIDNKITHAFMTTQVGRQFALYTKSTYFKHLLVGGETLVPLYNKDATFSIHNGYGPTEATAYVTQKLVDKMYYRVPIGKAHENVELYVVDKNMHRLPVGVPGELLISGSRVAKGYINLPEKTKQAFIKNPFSNDKEYENTYKTGDIVRYLSDGSIDLIGRADGQVKIRGFRIELTEVESIIREYKDIKDATVVAFDKKSGGKYLASYIVSDKKIDLDDLKKFIASNKPPYMVPEVIMQIEKIPLNQNHKVNKKALPKIERNTSNLILPKTDVQKEIYAIVKNVLSIDDFGITDDLYELGLTSIGMVNLNVELSKKFDKPMKISDLKDNNTIEKLEKFFSEKKEDDIKIDIKLEENEYPLTKTQEGIFVESTQDKTSVTYNIPVLFKISNELNQKKLVDSIQKAIDNHAYVNSRITMKENGDIRIVKNAIKNDIIEIVNVDTLPNMDTFVQPFDILNERLCRIKIYNVKTETDSYYLFIDFHHIIADGFSLNIFIDDIFSSYDGYEIKKELIDGFDIAIDELKERKTAKYEKAKNYYKDLLFDVEINTLPVNCPDSTPGIGDISRKGNLDISYIKDFCAENKISMNSFTNAVFAYVLSRFCYKEQVVFTTIYNGRNDTRLDRTMSMLVKTIPVVYRSTKDIKVKDYLKNMASQLLDNMANDIYSFSEIKNDFSVPADIIFAYQGDNFDLDNIRKGVSTVDVSKKVAKAPISFEISIKDNKFSYHLSFMKEKFSLDFINALINSYEIAIENFTKEEYVKNISLLSDKIKKEQDKFNNTKSQYDLIPINKIFEKQVLLHKDRACYIFDGKTFTYEYINKCANKVANFIIEKKINKNSIIGMFINRSENIPILQYGILKANCAFTPIIPDYPDDRVDYCLSNADSPMVITTEKIKNERKELFTSDKPYAVYTIEEILSNTKSEENPNIDIKMDDLAYCIYTSGTTGKPKGVLINQKNITCLVQNSIMAKLVTKKNGEPYIVLAMANITFDGSFIEHVCQTCIGNTVCLTKENDIHSPLDLSNLMVKNGVEYMFATPSLMSSFIDIEEFHEAIRKLKIYVTGAEAFPKSLYQKIKKINNNLIIVDAYGPSESTVLCNEKVISSDTDFDLGRPMDNAKFYIFDKDRNQLPYYALGELIIAGDIVGDGYVKLKEKTDSVFIAYNGDRAYCCGDVVRQKNNGNYLFYGRVDNLVKVRGYRIELDEIEKVMKLYDGITQTKVIVKNNGKEDYLAAYYQASKKVDQKELIKFMKTKLTYYMIPQAMMQLDKMPLNPSGKIDKTKLPEIVKEKKESKTSKKQLVNDIRDVFKLVLDLDDFDISDDFFAMGGTSLSASKVTMKLLTKNIEVEYGDIFDHPTPEDLASFIEEKQGTKDTEVDATDDDNIEKNFKKIADQRIKDVLRYNNKKYAKELKKEDLGDVLLTGANGFLGVHILRELLENEKGHIYCNIRKGTFLSSEERLKSVLFYYFDKSYEEMFKDRITLFDFDLTDDDVAERFKGIKINAIINAAACVKHYANDDIIEKINVKTVENLIKVALDKNAKLMQISTTSVPGAHNKVTYSRRITLYEDDLFCIDCENKYVLSKYKAEARVFEAIYEKKLKGKVARVGNLMGRASDGEFQINSTTNAFLNALKGFATLKHSPISHMTDPMSFSPIDYTAKAVVALTKTNDMFTAFNADSRFRFDEMQLIESCNRCGIEIEPIDDDLHYSDFNERLSNDKINKRLSALLTNDKPDVHPVETNNDFTTNILYRLGFSWPLVEKDYLDKVVMSLKTIGFFDEDDVNIEKDEGEE